MRITDIALQRYQEHRRAMGESFIRNREVAERFLRDLLAQSREYRFTNTERLGRLLRPGMIPQESWINGSLRFITQSHNGQVVLITVELVERLVPQGKFARPHYA